MGKAELNLGKENWHMYKIWFMLLGEVYYEFYSYFSINCPNNMDPSTLL